VAASGGLMAWHQADSLPTPEVGSVRALAPSVIRPLAPRLRVSSEGPGVALGSWARRIMLAWRSRLPMPSVGPGKAESSGGSILPSGLPRLHLLFIGPHHARESSVVRSIGRATVC